MGLLFKKLNKIISKGTSGSESLTISETLKNKKVGEVVLVGGIVESVISILETEPTIVILDDGIGKVHVSVIPEIFEIVGSKFSPGNVVVVKGYYTKRKYLYKHPENKNDSFMFVNCSAVTVIDEDLS